MTLGSGAWRRTLENTNDVLGGPLHVDGVKTGHTKAAGYVLVGSATGRGRTVISVVLGARSEGDRDAATLRLLRYGLRRDRRGVRASGRSRRDCPVRSRIAAASAPWAQWRWCPQVRPTPARCRSRCAAPHDGRWLGGVCRGMANRWSTPVAQLRALFVVAALFGGLGLLAYAACWLVLPTDADDDSPSLLRGLASVALLVAALAGLATIAAVTAAATLFGFGWAIAVALVAFLLGALLLLPSVGPAWVLPPLLAAALPAVVVAASGVRVLPQAGLDDRAPADGRARSPPTATAPASATSSSTCASCAPRRARSCR